MVDIAGALATCQLDTGANCYVISRRDIRKLPDKPEQTCLVMLIEFFGHKTGSHGKVRLLLSANEKAHEETFFVVEQDMPVTLSGTAAERLGFISCFQSVQHDHIYTPAQPFAEVFKGLGQPKHFKYKMKLKPGTTGVIVPARRVAVALEDRVKAELQRMQEHGVITKVTEPTNWSRPMITVVKKEKVHICLDPTELNKSL